MKHRHVHFSLLIVFITAYTTILKAAEEPKYDPVIVIDARITVTYPQTPFPTLTTLLNFNKLTEQNMVDIFNLISPYCDTENKTEKISESLSAKNSLFKQSIDYLVQQAVDNRKNVTCKTLANVENPSLQQPTKILDLIASLILKTFIMHKAQKQLTRSYTIDLTGHTDTICYFDIHIPTGRVLTSSKDNTIRLWLIDNKSDHVRDVIIKNDGIAQGLCFNRTGSHFATATRSSSSTSSKYVINQWELREEEIQRTHSFTYPTLRLAFMAYCNDNSIIVSSGPFANHDGRTTIAQEIFEFKADNQPRLTIDLPFAKMPYITRYGNIHDQELSYCYSLERCCSLEQPPYKAEVVKDNQKILRVTKENCHDLYLCMQAVKNSQPTDFLQTMVGKSHSYNQLNSYEKGMIIKQIQDKHAASLPTRESKKTK